MPMWGGYWGPAWGGFGWMFPVIGLLFMVVMILVCVRGMGGMMRGGCLTGHAGHSPSEVEELRREVRELKGEVEELRQGS